LFLIPCSLVGKNQCFGSTCFTKLKFKSAGSEFESRCWCRRGLFLVCNWRPDKQQGDNSTISFIFCKKWIIQKIKYQIYRKIKKMVQFDIWQMFVEAESPSSILVMLEDGVATFLDAFAKLRKATISFVLSVRLFAWNNSTPTRRIFMKFDI
jgi:hypothetical protein